ncbi:DUF3124 domain-containing protein [Oryzomonas sagensis]|uniref:DUF3124 domain-containing protein n=1 Tax=Oryzomonas sagensis TaxID=2603857 RepID=A0ABQ6TS65_9BACT|nr:DUF3124 domain-containing protein [Oryzomonas sagensis]KAB0671865.1 DUF3124 domain-containing protein [Oryzomonas sagensis]
MKHHPRIALAGLALLLAIFGHSPASAAPSAGEYRLSKGQAVYVPVYSNVFSGPKALPFSLATMLSIRNVDLHHPMRVTAIDYYDTGGKLLRSHLAKPLTLPPLGSTYVYLGEQDTAGGFGASFVVRWDARTAINAPIVECVMIGAKSGQGISFVSPGQVIKENTR